MPDSSRRARLLVLATVLAVATGIVLVALVRPLTNGPGAATATPGPTARSQSAIPSAPADAEVLLAAGDIGSCDSQSDEAVAALAARQPGTVALLGDIAYDDGSARDFEACFEPAWGPIQSRLRPAPGNHEYETRGASGYFDWFGSVAGEPGEGWYSYELGAWHIVALNSNCAAVGGCNASSPQVEWLESDLAAHPTDCLLAYWHHPRYSSGRHGSDDMTEGLWTTLAAAGVDVILVGHDHTYERILVDDVRQFVVGTGGRSLYPFERPALPTTEVRNDQTYGLLRLLLGEGTYEWQFLPAATSEFTDGGTGECAA